MKTLLLLCLIATLAGCLNQGAPDFHGCNPRGENYGPTQAKLDYWATHPEHDPRITPLSN